MHIHNNGGSGPVLTNCTFSGNNAYYSAGGGMYSDFNSTPLLTNCIIWNNKDVSGTGQKTSSFAFYNNNNPLTTNCLVQGYTTADSNGNLDGITNAATANYPLFVTLLDPTTAPSTGGNFHLQCSSPVIDKGSNAADTLSTDLNGNPRIVNSTIDLGAYENQGNCTQQPTTTTTAISSSLNPACFNSPVKFTATVLINGTNGNTPAKTGTVTFTQGTTVLAGNVATDTAGHASFSTNNLAAGIDTIVATYNAPQGLGTSKDSVNQTVNALPTASLNGGATYCNGSTTTTNLTVTVTGSGNFTGKLSDGTSFSGTAPTITVPVAPTSTITYTIVSLSDGNCMAQSTGLTGSAIVTVNARPTGSISGGAAYCSGYNTATSLTLTVTGSGTISGALSDGTPFTGTAPKITVPVSPTSTTNYTIAILNDANCTAQASDLSGSATITISAAPTVAPITYTGSTSVCSGFTVSLTDATAGGTWSASNAAATVSSSGTVKFSTVSASTMVSIYYTMKGSNGCTATAAITFTVNPPLVVKAITGNTTICGINSTTQLSDATSGGTWSSSGTAFATVRHNRPGYRQSCWFSYNLLLGIVRRLHCYSTDFCNDTYISVSKCYSR